LLLNMAALPSRSRTQSSGIKTGMMEMMLAGVKCALTGQPFRLPQELKNIAAAQEAISWNYLFKGRISKQWIEDSMIALETRPQRRTMP